MTFKIKFTCAYCAEIMPAEIQSLFSGLMLRCHRCEKITLVTLEKADEHAKRITMGKFYKPEA